MEQERKNIVEVALTDEELDQLLAYQRNEGFDTIQDGIINIIQLTMVYN